jgi:hypothetical protein
MNRIRRISPRIYQIEKLDNKKSFKLLYDDNKDEIRFKIDNYKELSNPSIIDEKIKILSLINTEESRKWIPVLEIAKVNGWHQIYDPKAFVQLKDKLKLYYNTIHDDFLVYFDILGVYRPITNMDNSIELSDSEIDRQKDSYYRIPYPVIKQIIIKDAKNEINNIYQFDLSPQTILSDMGRTLPKTIYIDFEKLNNSIANLSFMKNEFDDDIPSENLISLNIEEIIKIINLMTDNDYGINIKADYPEEDLLKRIAQHYEKIINPTLRFFFQNVKEKSLGEAMILTYMNFKNISFDSGYHSDYPKEYREKLNKMYKELKKYKIENLLNSVKNNKFVDVEVDENGNIININPLLKNSQLKNIVEIVGFHVEVSKYIL